jgi:hypothetical protein
MNTLRSEVFDAFRSIGIAEDKAVKAASALNERGKGLSALKPGINVLKWIMGFVLAFQVAIFARLFIH